MTAVGVIAWSRAVPRGSGRSPASPGCATGATVRAAGAAGRPTVEAATERRPGVAVRTSLLGRMSVPDVHAGMRPVGGVVGAGRGAAGCTERGADDPALSRAARRLVTGGAVTTGPADAGAEPADDPADAAASWAWRSASRSSRRVRGAASGTLSSGRTTPPRRNPRDPDGALTCRRRRRRDHETITGRGNPSKPPGRTSNRSAHRARRNPDRHSQDHARDTPHDTPSRPRDDRTTTVSGATGRGTKTQAGEPLSRL